MLETRTFVECLTLYVSLRYEACCWENSSVGTFSISLILKRSCAGTNTFGDLLHKYSSSNDILKFSKNCVRAICDESIGLYIIKEFTVVTLNIL